MGALWARLIQLLGRTHQLILPFFLFVLCWVTQGCGSDPSTADSQGDASASSSGGSHADEAEDVTEAPADGVYPMDSATDGGVPTERLPLDEVLSPGEVRAGVMALESELIAGPKREGQLGDAKIYNAHAAFVIEGARRAGGYRHRGGNVVDAVTIAQDGSYGLDRYGDLFWAWNLDIFWPEELEIIADGRDGDGAHIRVRGKTGAFAFADSFLASFLGADPPGFELIYDYTLGADDRFLRLDLTIENPGDKTVSLDWIIVMATFGDGAHFFMPERGFDQQLAGEPVPYYAAVGLEQSYAFIPQANDLTTFYTYAGVSVMQLEPFDVLPKASLIRTFYYAVSDTGLSGLEDRLADVQANPVERHPVNGAISVPATVLEGAAWIAVRRQADGAVMSLLPLMADGTFACSLPSGSYELEAYAEGHAAADPVLFEVPLNEETVIETAIPEPALVSVSVTDVDTGDYIPSRVTFMRQGDTPSPYAPVDVRPKQKSWSGATSAVAYVTASEHLLWLPAGTYSVTASHGFSYEIDQQEITLTVGENPSMHFSLKKAVDTTGWLSSDFHIHAVWSPDSYVPWDIRARQAATENLDLPILTEHVYAGSLAGAVAEAGLDAHVIGIGGQEVTTFEYGHFNAFPLVWDPAQPNHGAIFPYDKKPHELFAAIRDQHSGDEVIQVNHPRGASISGYFSWVGLDAENDTVTRPEHWSMDWEAIEVFNGNCGLGEVFDDWVGLTNHGYRKTLASGSDSHGEYSLPGVPRNWIKVDEDAVRDDPSNLVPAVRNRHMFVSCGPFLRFEAIADDGEIVGLGEQISLAADDETVTFHIRVDAPTWIPLHTVRIRQNGVIIDQIDVTESADPVVRIDTELSYEVASDAWFVAEAIGSGSMYPMIGSGPPYAITNPIEVDADGDGIWIPPAQQ